MADGAESKAEKLARPERVGLTYRCKYCGLPKRGHVCLVGPSGAGGEAKGSGSKPKKQKEKSEKQLAKQDSDATQEGEAAWDAKSIFKDIKSVLPAPGSEKKKKSSGSKRKKKDEEAEDEGSSTPLQALSVAAEQAQKLQDEFEFEVPRSMPRPPPCVITPDDGDGTLAGPNSAGPCSMSAPPASLASVSAFTPGQLMSHFLDTPAPPITAHLSPGTLQALSVDVASPGPGAVRPASSRRSARQQAAA